MVLQNETTQLLKMCGKLRVSDRMGEIGTTAQQHQHAQMTTRATATTINTKFEELERQTQQSLFLCTSVLKRL